MRRAQHECERFRQFSPSAETLIPSSCEESIVNAASSAASNLLLPKVFMAPSALTCGTTGNIRLRLFLRHRLHRGMTSARLSTWLSLSPAEVGIIRNRISKISRRGDDAPVLRGEFAESPPSRRKGFLLLPERRKDQRQGAYELTSNRGKTIVLALAANLFFTNYPPMESVKVSYAIKACF